MWTNELQNIWRLISRIYAESPQKCLPSKQLCKVDSSINSKSAWILRCLLRKVLTADQEKTRIMAKCAVAEYQLTKTHFYLTGAYLLFACLLYFKTREIILLPSPSSLLCIQRKLPKSLPYLWERLPWNLISQRRQLVLTGDILSPLN